MKKGILRLGTGLGIVIFLILWIGFSVFFMSSGPGIFSIWSCMFSGLILIPLVLTIIFIGILLGIYTMIRWIYVGFKEDKK